jgi:serine/threonine-protein kinase
LIEEHAPGTRIGSYEIRGTIAHGGMGSVYLAKGIHGEAVALKLLKPDLARDELTRKRFEREARMAQRIEHPNVVPVLDIGEHEGSPYLIQAFVRGGSLQDRLDATGPLTVPEMVRMALEVGGALHAIHAFGLVHRDVKPANILLDEQDVAHVIDFGLAKDSQASALTRPGQAVGSIDYMAPEQIRAEEVGPWTDVYGLGCVLYTALTGNAPFAAKSGMGVLWAHLQEDPPPLPASVPPPVAWSILEGLAKEPTDRPPTTVEYAASIAAAAA